MIFDLLFWDMFLLCVSGSQPFQTLMAMNGMSLCPIVVFASCRISPLAFALDHIESPPGTTLNKSARGVSLSFTAFHTMVSLSAADILLIDMVPVYVSKSSIFILS